MIFKGVVERIVDGDTLTIRVDLGFSISHVIRVRLYTVKAPELPKIEGMNAQKRLQEMVPLGMACELQTIKLDSYARWVSIVRVNRDTLNDPMND